MFISGFAGSWKHEAEGVVWFLSIDLGLSARLRLISSLSLISSGLGKFMKSFSEIPSQLPAKASWGTRLAVVLPYGGTG